MSELTRSNRAASVACAVAMAATIMVAVPVWAHEEPTTPTTPTDAKPTTSGSMDHSKMEGMKEMGGMSMTGDTDYDFAAMMRKHHQMAVDLSQAQLKKGKNPQMLQMAKDIIAAQKKEIAVLDQWMAAHGKPMTHPMPTTK